MKQYLINLLDNFESKLITKKILNNHLSQIDALCLTATQNIKDRLLNISSKCEPNVTCFLEIYLSDLTGEFQDDTASSHNP